MNALTHFKLPVRRSFSWRALWILVALQLIGNLAAIPLLRITMTQIEPLMNWILWTSVSVLVVGLGLWLGSRIGLGAPYLEGQMKRKKLSAWLRTVLAYVLIITIGASIPLLILNLNADPTAYPASWMLFLSSIDAGIQEEIFSRLLMLTLFAWLGSLLWTDENGFPTHGVMWCAVILSGLLFGFAHIDDVTMTLDNASTLIAVFLMSSLLGIVFGWFYWILGIESAILAHFLVDAVYSGIIVPVYQSKNAWVYAVTIGGLILVLIAAFRLLRVESPGN